jgi:hypothetical protein
MEYMYLSVDTILQSLCFLNLRDTYTPYVGADGMLRKHKLWSIVSTERYIYSICRCCWNVEETQALEYCIN